MNWLKAVGDASTTDALLAIVNDFLLQQPEDQWSCIPRGSRPSLIADAAELYHWHRKLADDFAAIAVPNIRMQDLRVFFLRASARAIELEGEAANADAEAATEATKAV
jgi:hypothetical protein